MSLLVNFVECLDPVAKGRPRFGQGRTYTDAKTRRFERDFSALAAKHKPATPLDGPLEMAILFQIKKPKSVSRKREYPHVRPDLDNYVKAVMDALKGFWKDDGQIICIYARKRYGLLPFIKVSIARAGELITQKGGFLC